MFLSRFSAIMFVDLKAFITWDDRIKSVQGGIIWPLSQATFPPEDKWWKSSSQYSTEMMQKHSQVCNFDSKFTRHKV